MAGRTIALTVPRVNPSKTDKTHPTGRFRRNILSPHVFDLPAYSEDGTKKPPGKMPGGGYVIIEISPFSRPDRA